MMGASHKIPPRSTRRQAHFRSEAAAAIGHAIFRLDEYAVRAVLRDHIGRAEWAISRAEGHLKKARVALRAWRKERRR